MYRWLLIITFSNFLIFTSSAQVVVETGVSEKLASYRKQVINKVHYTIKLDIPSLKNIPIVASEIIRFELKENKFPLQLDFKEERNHIKSISVNQKSIPVIFESEHIIIGTEYLRTGVNSVSINFVAGDLSLNRNDDFLYTLLVPDRARTLFPCFDQPSIKAEFKLSLTIPKSWKALCNAPLQDSIVHSSVKTYNYHSSDKISTYLFSFAAGKFERVTKILNGRVMNFYHRETDAGKLKMSIDSIFRLHNEALKFMESYTAIPFPFKKFDFIAIPDFQYGGMEHVGAIQYRSSSLFLDSAATQDQLNSRAALIAHETAHMWFGDLVTMEWFNDVWMKEVFANFMADKITQGNQSNNKFELKFLIDHFPAAYGVDRTPGANPIRQPLENLQEAGSLYGNIIYHKAPIMMRQLEILMGKTDFRNGLREYLTKYKFRNATWPDLISILDKKTKADLREWNKLWVNHSGRPLLSFSYKDSSGFMTNFIIRQTDETGKPYDLPQFFKIAFYTPNFDFNPIEEFPIHLDSSNYHVKMFDGKRRPFFFLFNSSGEGYGKFPVDRKMIRLNMSFKNPVMRASAYINLYENILNGEVLHPDDLLVTYLNLIPEEPEELILSLITRQISDIFWRYEMTDKRLKNASVLEESLWNALQNDSVPNRKKILFRTWQSICLTKESIEQLYRIWKEQKPPEGVKLNDDDYASIALTLVLKNHPAKDILSQQLSRIKNTDRKKRFEFIMPAVSPDQTVRDSFFLSLKEEKNRERETWVIAALEYLHHPLRTSASEKYLLQTLQLLEEIQKTGDIFFPYSWLNASFGYYQTPSAYKIVTDFLDNNKDYNPKLKAKILQATDPLKRAKELLYDGKHSYN